MPYIDADYYLNTYKGVPAADISTLEQLINQASNDIDRVSGYRITDFENQPQYVQDQIKKAVAAQTEHLVNKANSGIDGGVNVTIGKFKYTSSNAEGSTNSEFAPAVVPLLNASGIMYTGVRVIW